MPLRLVAIPDGADILLDKPIVVIGRHEECDIQIHSRKISRKHCCIAQVNGYFVVRDLFSTNGIRINGTPVEEGKLNIGDELCIGHFRYQLTAGPKDSQNSDQTIPRSIEADSLDEPVALADLPGPGPLDAPTERAISLADPMEHTDPIEPGDVPGA